MQVLQLAAGVLFWLSFALGEVFINASIAEHLGFPYDPSLDYSSTWSNLPEEDLLKLNDLRIDINDPINIIAHNILLAIYGGNYDYINTHDIYDTVKEVFELLGPKHQKFRINFPPLSKVAQVAQSARSVPKDEVPPSPWDFSLSNGRTIGEPAPNTYCEMKKGGYCASWKRKDTLRWLFFEYTPDECTWKCFSNPSVDFDFSDEYERTSSADLCLAERPDDCLEV